MSSTRTEPRLLSDERLEAERDWRAWVATPHELRGKDGLDTRDTALCTLPQMTL